MKTNNNSSSCTCGGCITSGTVWGIILGVIIGILFALGFIPLIVTGIWIAFGIASFILIYILGILFLGSCSDSCSVPLRCLRKNLVCLLIGTLGTIITALAALSIVLDISVIAIIVLVALGTFFFTFLIIGIISFIRCVVRHSS